MLVFEEVGETSKGGFEGVEGGEIGGGAGLPAGETRVGDRHDPFGRLGVEPRNETADFMIAQMF
jgi:hypothetical protein